MEKGKDIKFRSDLIFIVILIAAIGIIAKPIHLQITEGDKLDSVKRAQSLKKIVIEPNRGNILASDGRLLAISLPMYDIRMDTRASKLTDKGYKNVSCKEQ